MNLKTAAVGGIAISKGSYCWSFSFSVVSVTALRIALHHIKKCFSSEKVSICWMEWYPYLKRE